MRYIIREAGTDIAAFSHINDAVHYIEQLRASYQTRTYKLIYTRNADKCHEEIELK